MSTQITTNQNSTQTTKLLQVVALTTVALGMIPSEAFGAIREPARISHAKELLGHAYKKSIVRKSEKVKDMNEFVEQMTAKFLPAKHRSRAHAVARALVEESNRHGFDPVFVMALIQNESSFNPDMKGLVGEIGLMQIKPDTAEWVAKKMSLKYKGASSLYDPVENIRIGTAFIAMLRGQFPSRSHLYVSAYNMGAKKVRQLVSANRAPQVYVSAVLKRYEALYSGISTEQDTGSRIASAMDHIRGVTRKIAALQ